MYVLWRNEKCVWNFHLEASTIEVGAPDLEFLMGTQVHLGILAITV
jgi:hypothetical protein